MSKHIGEVGTINKNDGLYIYRDFFFAINFLTQKDGPPLVSFVHNFFQMFHSLNITAATYGFAFTYY